MKKYRDRLIAEFEQFWGVMVERAEAILQRSPSTRIEEILFDQDLWFDIYDQTLYNEGQEFWEGEYHEDNLIPHLEESVWLAAAGHRSKDKVVRIIADNAIGTPRS